MQQIGAGPCRELAMIHEEEGHQARRVVAGWRANVVLALASFSLSIMLAEGLLRLWQIEYPVFVNPDSRFGFWHVPNAQGWWRYEGESYVEINPDGMRDITHSRRKGAHTFRVAVLGDSFSEAFQVPFEATFCSQLRRNLQAMAPGGCRVEVLNFGMSGFGTGQELLVWRQLASQFQPDLVLLAVLTGNDIADNSRSLRGIAYLPYFVMRNGTPVLDEGYTRERSYLWRIRLTPLYNATSHSRLLQLLRKAIVTEPSPRVSGSDDAESLLTQENDSAPYSPPTDGRWSEAWAITEELITVMDAEVRSTGARFAVVTLSNSLQVHPNRSLREAVARKLGVHDLFYPDSRLRLFSGRAGIPILTLAPQMAEEAERTEVYFHGFQPQMGVGHWNARGHAFAGKAIARWLTDGGGTVWSSDVEESSGQRVQGCGTVSAN